MANTDKNKKVVPVRIIVLGAVAAVVVIAMVASMLMGNDAPQTSIVMLSAGNRGGNIANGGTAVESNGTVFLSDAVTGEIMKVQAGQTTGTSLGVKGRYLNTDGTNLWYVDQDTGLLMKTDLNGSAPAQVLSGRVDRPQLAGDYIYYIDVDSNYALSRISTAANEPAELLSDARVMQFAIVGQKIFYRNLNGADCASYMNLDGSGATEIQSIRFGQMLFGQGRRLYYTNEDRGGAIDFYELGDDNQYHGPASNGAAAAIVDTGTITCAAADNSTLYYVKASDGCLYKRSLALTNPPTLQEDRLTDYPVYGVQEAGGYIYVQSIPDGGQFKAIAK